MNSNSLNSLPVNSNNLLLPWECNDQSFNRYYYMVTIKNNTSPKKEYTDPNRYTMQANRLLIRGFHHIKSAFELDSKDQLHFHMVCYHEKNINRVVTSKFLKQFEKTFCHDIKPIETKAHLMNAYDYLDPTLTSISIARYKYYFYPNDSCDFVDTPEDVVHCKYLETAKKL